MLATRLLRYRRHQAREHGGIDRGHNGCRVSPAVLQLVHVFELKGNDQARRHA